MADLVTPIVNGQAIKTDTTKSSKKENVAGGELGKDAFLQLLVTQMQNQDPLEPTSNSDYIAQLATYSQVEELQNIGTTMSQIQSLNLVGKNVDVTYSLSDSTNKTVSGKVEYTTMKNNIAYITIDGKQYEASNVTNVYSDEYYNSLKDKTDKTDAADKTDASNETEGDSKKSS